MKFDLITYLKNNPLNEIKVGSELGKGKEGIVYSHPEDPNKVIKKIENPRSDTYKNYKLMQDYPDVFAKIYEINEQEKYVILEKLIFPFPGLKELQNFINKDLGIIYKPGQNQNNRFAGDVVFALFEEVKQGDGPDEVSKEIFSKLSGDKKSLFEKIRNYLLNSQQILGNKIFNDFNDVSIDNIGANEEGKLKILDL